MKSINEEQLKKLREIPGALEQRKIVQEMKTLTINIDLLKTTRVFLEEKAKKKDLSLEEYVANIVGEKLLMTVFPEAVRASLKFGELISRKYENDGIDYDSDTEFDTDIAWR